MPAPPQNRNATKSGLYGYLAIGSLPKGASYIRRLMGEFERGLRAAVLAKSGELTLYAAAVCQTATRHEARAMLLQRWLRKADAAGDKVPLMDRVAIMREIGAASDSRDRCLRALGLERSDSNDVIDALYPRAAVADPDDPPAPSPTPAANGRNGAGAAAIAPAARPAADAKLRNDSPEKTA